MNNNYSVQNISNELLEEIKNALVSVSNFGSVEIFVQQGNVTQITVRKIKKTASHIKSPK